MGVAPPVCPARYMSCSSNSIKGQTRVNCLLHCLLLPHRWGAHEAKKNYARKDSFDVKPQQHT